MHVSISHPTDRPNFTEVTIGPVTLWFSYKTVVGFQGDGSRKVSENLWGPTTGKHLNYIATSEPRMARDEFEQELERVLAPLSVTV